MQNRSPAALCRGDAEANLVRGNFLRMTDLRSRSAYISVADISRTTPRRVVELSEPAPHRVTKRKRVRRANSSDQEALAGFNRQDARQQ